MATSVVSLHDQRTHLLGIYIVYHTQMHTQHNTVSHDQRVPMKHGAGYSYQAVG